MERIRDEVARVLDSIGIERKAIPTLYNGVTYRSRLEARWAVFLDYIGVEHVFEYEGFELPTANYLPDFYLPQMGAWIEIKPTDPKPIERRLCEELAIATGERVYIGIGLPHDWRGIDPIWIEDGVICGDCDEYAFCHCPACGKAGVQFHGRSYRVCGSRCFPGDKGTAGERVIGGAVAAKIASFWNPK